MPEGEFRILAPDSKDELKERVWYGKNKNKVSYPKHSVPAHIPLRMPGFDARAAV